MAIKKIFSMYIKSNIFLFIIAIVIGIILGIILNKSNIKQVFTSKPLPPSYFSLANPPKESIIGKVEAATGDVEVTSRIATAPSALKSTSQILQGESLDTKSKGGISLNFANSETISLKKNSHIDLIQALKANIVVNQTMGNVDYLKTGNIPLSIISQNLLLDQISGEMEVSVDKSTNQVTASLLSGSAKAAFNDSNDNSQVVTLQKGDNYIFSNQTLSGTAQ